MSNTLHNDLTERKFDYLTVIKRSDNRGGGKKPAVMWECSCRCGKTVIATGYALTTGHTKSCGCRKVKHGFSHKERLYETWKNMRRRCNDPTNKRYAQYGGRGITICPEWGEYINFRTWALEYGYSDDLTIDRKNVDGNYCPENCRWADAKTQANNVSRNHIIEFNGISMTMSQLADRLNLTYSALQHRIERGWSIDRIAQQEQRG